MRDRRTAACRVATRRDCDATGVSAADRLVITFDQVGRGADKVQVSGALDGDIRLCVRTGDDSVSGLRTGKDVTMFETQFFVNHIGYLPKGAKNFVVRYPRSTSFSIINRWDKSVVYEDCLTPVLGGDLDEAYTGCFTEMKQSGTYVVKCGGAVSQIVVVHEKQYELAMRTVYNYYPTQRCGDSETGWNSPCHLKPCEDSRTGELTDVTGGWHQSCDLRKWLSTLTGLHALFALGQYEPLRRWSERRVDEEIKWGNLYFHKMVRPDGGLMDFVSVPNDWDVSRTRRLVSDDTSYSNFFSMISGQCKSAMHFKQRDPAYAQTCLDVALTLWDYVNSDRMPRKYSPVPFKYHEYLADMVRQCFYGSSIYYGDMLYAAILLYQATDDRKYLDVAASAADGLCALQLEGEVEDDLSAACFWVDDTKTEISYGLGGGHGGPIGLWHITKLYPGHKNIALWHNAMRKIALQYVLSSKRNPWGLVASYWFTSDIGGCRRAGNRYYKYFLPDENLSLGVNTDILTQAIFLFSCASDLDFASECVNTANRQIDWVLGCNPFNSSSCEGVGYNQQQLLINSDEFIPPVPQIPGGVQTGIGCIYGTDTPQLRFGPKGDVTTEYNMPETSALLEALAAALSA